MARSSHGIGKHERAKAGMAHKTSNTLAMEPQATSSGTCSPNHKAATPWLLKDSMADRNSRNPTVATESRRWDTPPSSAACDRNPASIAADSATCATAEATTSHGHRLSGTRDSSPPGRARLPSQINEATTANVQNDRRLLAKSPRFWPQNSASSPWESVHPMNSFKQRLTAERHQPGSLEIRIAGEFQCCRREETASRRLRASCADAVLAPAKALANRLASSRSTSAALSPLRPLSHA
mmetsp:Transcript_34902/g.91265  ORF Transcript_34902/g.91265 Transcript_34902/m.91265 type:complete len:239 (-) Transcript_34902:101-817(-)